VGYGTTIPATALPSVAAPSGSERGMWMDEPVVSPDNHAAATFVGTVGVGRVGIFLGPHAALPATQLRQTARLIEELGYGTIWVGEGFFREVFSQCAMLLSVTERITIASGIANIYVRDAVAMANGARALAEAWPDRFVLGLGVSHAHLVSRRGHDYPKPVPAMREYLDAMAQAPYMSPLPEHPAPIVLGALGPRMIALAGERTAGAYTYFADAAHTRGARGLLGPGTFLAANMPTVVAADAATARTIGEGQMKLYLGMPNYTQNLVRGGWAEDELAGAGSDRLFDAIVAWGDPAGLRERVQRHFDAGADHAVLNVISATPDRPAEAELRVIAEALLH
jgi:probable F420-dependent oxidoreductase